MKVFFVTFFVLFIVFFPCFSDQEGTTDNGERVLLRDDGTWEYIKEELSRDFDFKKTYWGMNRDQVKQSEREEPVSEQPNYIAYNTSLAGLKCILFYVFTNNQLTRTTYAITETHLNKKQYIDDYDTLIGLLKKKYGTPTDEDIVWHDTMYKSDRSMWSWAIEQGDLVYHATWDLERTKLLCTLKGDDFEIVLIIQYSSKALSVLEDKKVLDSL